MTWQRPVLREAEIPVHVGMHARHRVRHVLDPQRWVEQDPFLMLAEDWFTPGTFGDHPHRGFETVTLVLEGSVEHRDNHGGYGVLHPGDAQWMTAGRGVVHSEEAGPDGAHSLQLWVNLPRALKMTAPRYQDLRGADMPVRREAGAELRTFAPSDPHWPVAMVEMRLDAGASVSEELPSNYTAFVYDVTNGRVTWFERRDDDAPSTIAIHATSAMHAVLWAGPPIREPVAASGPFVMNTVGEVRQAYLDFQAGRF